MADREEFRGRVTLLGPRSDIGDLLAAADLFVMPSRWEGLPLALIEAMFASTPIVAAAVGGIPEAIRSDNEGLLVAAGNPVDLRAAIRQALEYPDCAAAMARQALAVARARYSITAMTDAYEGLYATA
jgi:glycosyltransferase involved in cell wall biosynthesis